MIVGTSTPGFGVFLLVVFALQADPVSVKRVAFSRRYISNPAPPAQVGVCAWMAYQSEWDSIKTGGRGQRVLCGGDAFVCVRGRVCVCATERERECQRMEEGRISRERRGGYAARQRRTIMNTKLRTYQRRAKGTGRRISGLGLPCTRAQQGTKRWLVWMLTQLRFYCSDRCGYYKVVWRTAANVLQN